MLAEQNKNNCEFGSQFLDSISIPQDRLNMLFAALFLTTVGVFLGGNLLVRDANVMKATMPIALVCFALLLNLYTLANFLKSLAWAWVATYGAMILVAYVRMPFFTTLFYVSVCFSFLYTVKSLHIKIKDCGLVVLMALISTVILLGYDGYTSFDMLQRAGTGSINPDTLFHASIAAMIKNYGVVSTGLHGLIETPYHALSHALIASISVLAGVGVLEVYGVAPQILFAPILIFSIAVCCITLDIKKTFNTAYVWATVCVCLSLAPILFGKWGFWSSYFISESYLVSLGLLLFGLPLLFKRGLTLIDFVLVVILTAFIANAKASVGLIYFGLWLLKFVFFRDQKFYLELLALISLGSVVSFIVFQSVEANAATEIVLFDFISRYSFYGANLSELERYFQNAGFLSLRSAILGPIAFFTFFICHFAFSWMVVACSVYTQGWQAIIKSPAVVYSFGAIAAGSIIIILFAIPAGAAYYFSNVAFFVSLPSVIILILTYCDMLAKRLGIKAGILFVLILCFILIFILSAKNLKHAFLEPAEPNQNNAFVNSLVELRERSPINVFIRPATEALSNNPQKICWAQPFMYPAISERPWIDVIPSGNNTCLYQYYGYTQYGLTAERRNIAISPKLRPEMHELIWR